MRYASWDLLDKDPPVAPMQETMVFVFLELANILGVQDVALPEDMPTEIGAYLMALEQEVDAMNGVGVSDVIK